MLTYASGDGDAGADRHHKAASVADATGYAARR
jgi:hypothetical protein